MIEVVLIGVVIVAATYHYLFRRLNYWNERGVQQKQSIWCVTDFINFLLLRPFRTYIIELYNEYRGLRYFGIYHFTKPTLVVRDPDLIKQLTVGHFDHFTDHTVFVPDNEPLWSKNLISLTGLFPPSVQNQSEIRKRKSKSPFLLFRTKLAPNETNSKPQLYECQEVVEVEVKDVFNRYSSDVISTTAFGYKNNSVAQPNNEFYLMLRRASNLNTLKTILKCIMFGTIPKLYRALNIKLFTNEVSSFFIDLVDHNVKEREEKGIVRPDLIHLMLQARKGTESKDEKNLIDTGYATAATQESDLGKVVRREITNLDIAAQALVFLMAGADSPATSMSFTAYELAINPTIQNRLREEVQDTFDGCQGNLTYESLMKMKYLDMVVSESIRKWPNFSVTDRICTKPFTIAPVAPDEKPVVIEKGTAIWIPIAAIQNDPAYFPDPDSFDPERFNDENKERINPYTYSVFGLGPRNCIGSRYALLAIKTLFFYLMLNFEIVVTSATQIPVKIAVNGPIGIAAEGGIHLGFKKIKK